ncbi:BMP family ABC transporter substrate-binding protein [Solihabitans fulvus]|uniref:BMP family ABC transporter substrate-binding protein n=1 Tax=Solihabitans fulvus TaxID=1892852 RepID=A0A5B2XNI9_9PSEU|nr:BMP family ABC transporter substrate-binding protein [Solihabitans fulvus]KAA2264923.1 BMP family ABC transporter substrate-binding protein [Solihabitans fulvus]
MRGVAVVAVALTSALSLAACAKDSGNSSNNNNASGNPSSGCKLADKPAAAPAGSTSADAGGKVDGSALKIGLAYDIGGRGDGSFNDAAAAGLDKAISDMGVKKDNTKELTASANESPADKETRLRQLATGGYNPVITVGFAYADALKKVAAEFPGTKFAIVDATVDGAANVTPLTFTEEQGSFLVGVAAAYKSKGCHIGFVGGVDVPLIQKFQAGFAQGAKAAAPDIKIESKYISPAGDFSGFQDPNKGNVVTKGELDAGADVVYQAAGKSGEGVFAAAKAANKLAIGVDSDQYNQPTVAANKDVIITSMVKRVDVAVYDFIRAFAKNDLTTVPKVFDLKADGVGYATSGGKIDDIKDVLEAYKAQIVAGKITVSATPTK